MTVKMKNDEMTLAGVEITSIVLRKADTLTQVTEKNLLCHPSLPHMFMQTVILVTCGFNKND